MPAKLTIPEEALPDLERLVKLDDDSFDALIAALRVMKPTLTRTQLEKQLDGKLSFADKLDLPAILTPALVFFSLMENTATSAGEIADAVANSAELEASERFTSESRVKLKIRLEQLLGLESTLGVTAKALSVMTEHEHTFCSARILSDIRPVFSANGERASAAAIIHNLQLSFHEGGKHAEFFVALDTDDLKSLKDAIERAQKKTAAMEAILEAAEVPYLEV